MVTFSCILLSGIPTRTILIVLFLSSNHKFAQCDCSEGTVTDFREPYSKGIPVRLDSSTAFNSPLLVEVEIRWQENVKQLEIKSSMSNMRKFFITSPPFFNYWFKIFKSKPFIYYIINIVKSNLMKNGY